MNIIDKGTTSHDTRTRRGVSEVYMIVELDPVDYEGLLDYFHGALGVWNEGPIKRFFSDLGIEIRNKNESEDVMSDE